MDSSEPLDGWKGAKRKSTGPIISEGQPVNTSDWDEDDGWSDKPPPPPNQKPTHKETQDSPQGFAKTSKRTRTSGTDPSGSGNNHPWLGGETFDLIHWDQNKEKRAAPREKEEEGKPPKSPKKEGGFKLHPGCKDCIHATTRPIRKGYAHIMEKW